MLEKGSTDTSLHRPKPGFGGKLMLTRIWKYFSRYSTGQKYGLTFFRFLKLL